MTDVITNSYGWDETLQMSYAQESLNGEIVLLGGHAVGVITLAEWADQLHLVWMAVLPRMQGQGLGTALIKYSQQKARALNKVLTLQVLKINPACSLYEKCGFENFDENGPHKLLMRWPPNQS